jgi:hypothetical protein
MMARWLVACALVAASAPPGQPPAWRTFEGSWSVTGQRYAVPTETGRDAAAIHVSGAVVLTAGDGLSRGFRGVVVGFDGGGASASIGRSVWTDERGDRIFATVESDGLASGRRFTGAIAGGTGRYAGITGNFEFTWQYVVAADDGTIQGRTTALHGRFRPQAGVP